MIKPEKNRGRTSQGNEGVPTAHFAANLDALPEQLIRVPRKLEIPPNFAGKFEELRKKITARVQALGPPSKISDALWCLALEVNEGVIRPGFLGRERPDFTQRMDRLFGDGNWSTMHVFKSRLVPHTKALQLYEDAYHEFFKKNKGTLDWLTNNYRDVVDNAPSNTASGFDYAIQEVPERGHHIHDIAIRNAVRRLGCEFRGNDILQVRGKFLKNKPSEGFILSPGEIPFHQPELIPPEPFLGRTPWWKERTIEHFYQASRRIVVNEMTADPAFPADLHASQSRESYPHRVAARMTLRTLLVMLEPQATLTDVAFLPWMMDYNSFPIGDDGLPRQFSNKEILTILRSSHDQLQGLLQRSGEQQHLLTPHGWSSFNDAKEFIDAIEADQNGILSEDQAERYPDIVDIVEWSKALPLFQKFFATSEARPLFLARDGLAVMEYLTYAMLIDGSTRADANEALQRTIYLPGSPNQKTTRNQRADHPLFNSTTFEVNRIAIECKEELQLFTPPQDIETRQRLHALFEEKTHELLRAWRDEPSSDGSAQRLYEFWYDAYTSIKSRFAENLHGVTLVDSDGTGKTALFIRSVLTFFAEERGDSASIGILLGALQPEHLGVQNLAEMHSAHGALPDVRWPFRFETFNSEPVFNLRHSPKNVLALIYRSLSYYNIAVGASGPPQSEENQ